MTCNTLCPPRLSRMATTGKPACRRTANRQLRRVSQTRRRSPCGTACKPRRRAGTACWNAIPCRVSRRACPCPPTRRETTQARLNALGPDAFALAPQYLFVGRLFYPEELENGADGILLDEQLALALFRVAEPVGRTVTVSGVEFTVIGVLRHSKRVGDSMDYAAYVTLASLWDEAIQLDALQVTARPVSGAGARASFLTDMETWQAGGTLIDLRKEAVGALLPLRVLLFVCGAAVFFRLLGRLGPAASMVCRRYQRTAKAGIRAEARIASARGSASFYTGRRAAGAWRRRADPIYRCSGLHLPGVGYRPYWWTGGISKLPSGRCGRTRPGSWSCAVRSSSASAISACSQRGSARRRPWCWPAFGRVSCTNKPSVPPPDIPHTRLLSVLYCVLAPYSVK